MRCEPTLVPEWLRSPGSVSGGGNLAHHFVSTSSTSANYKRRYPRNVGDKDSSHSEFLDRTSLSNRQRSSSSNSSSKHPYSSFGRSHRDKNRDKVRERSDSGDLWDHDGLDPLGDILISRREKDTLSPSLSVLYRKPGEVFRQRAGDTKNGCSNKPTCSTFSGGNFANSIHKTGFENDFPSLRTEEKQGVPDAGRVSSSGLSSAVQSLPLSSPGFAGGERWNSVLVEVPTIIGSNRTSSMPVQQGTGVTSSYGASSSVAGLNMAETLTQAPSQPRTMLQQPDKTQRLEELAIKQSRQLIPMTPLMPKGLVLSSDKLKLKTAVRASEMTGAMKSAQRQSHSNQLSNQSIRGEQLRLVAPRSSQAGKFLVLKQARENGVSSMAMDIPSPTNNDNRLASGELAAAHVSISASLKTKSSSKLSTVEHKVAALAVGTGSAMEKKSPSSHAQSRSDFFNLMRKKTSMNTSGILSDSGVAVSSSPMDKSGEVVQEACPTVCPCIVGNGNEVASHGHTHERENNLCLNEAVYADEEEVAFLRSLGWEENAGEDDGLTEEEINAFFEEYKKLRPTLKICRGVEPKLSMLSESRMAGLSKASSN
ncbi:uncharacterized protein LOC127800379 isoform X2 [Diospyros lotus]|uniref:uncharacterized protein LOC127800379 isoform X2 n=1 Tax=Diospyros lotus TaxID=55363 RepID=UPI00225BD10C|nr:uncharacterized protein LOC127800379 isoform X2 [Diospyros lotus]